MLVANERDFKNSNPGEIERGAVRLINDLPTKWVKSRVDLILEFFFILEIFQRIKSWRVISGIKDLQTWRQPSRSVWIDDLKAEVFFKHLQQPKTLQLIARKCLRVKIACLSGNSHCPLCGSAFYAVTANIPS